MLADMNVPEEYVSTLRGDGHDVVYSRAALGPEATDDAIVAYAASEGMAVSELPHPARPDGLAEGGGLAPTFS